MSLATAAQSDAAAGHGSAAQGNATATLRMATDMRGMAEALTRNALTGKAMTEGGLMAQMSRLAKGLRRAYAMSWAPTVADFAAAAGVSYSWLTDNMTREQVLDIFGKEQ